MPADTCEGISATRLWTWVINHYHLQAVVTFAPEASPFPGIDTNPLIFLIQNQQQPVEDFLWARCSVIETEQLKTWMLTDLRSHPGEHITVERRNFREGIATGLSRSPMVRQNGTSKLSDFAKVMRGIATGSNEFFFLTTRQTTKMMIPETFLRPAVGRTRDISGYEITSETLRILENHGKPTLLFCPDSRSIDQFPDTVQHYLRKGEALGLPQKPLLSTRHPWYKMETRSVPSFLFAYLGRRQARFIRNYANVVPLTSFLCVYPIQDDPDFIERLWQVLRHPDTLANLPFVGKSYGAGAIKVEPRALEQLPLPDSVVQSFL